MGALVAHLAVSLDGYHAAADGDLPWHTIDEEYKAFAVEQLDGTGALVFGRVTYTAMAEFWPSPLGDETDHATAIRMNRLPKVVCSTTLKDASWSPTTVVRHEAAKALNKLKGDVNGDLLILGSSHLLASLIPTGVVDEIRLLVVPVVLGVGLRALEGLAQRVQFDLRGVRRFASGNLLLTYRPETPV